MSTTNVTMIRPCTPGELAMMYEVSTKVLRNWLQPHLPAIGDRIGRYYTALQVRIIFERLGPPPEND